MSQIVLQISVSQLTTKKMYKTEKVKEILSTVCALLNSGGGQLELRNSDENPSQENVNDSVKMIEQRLLAMIGVTVMALCIEIAVSLEKIVMNVRQASKLISVNYYLYLPCESEVNEVQTTAATDEITEILQRRIVEDCVVIGTHVKRFVKHENSGLVESTDIQLKNLKSDSSDLADRITGKGNKFTPYISAFANDRGGHIYYGINDKGIVEGETTTEKEKDEIEKKVAETIDKMVWPQNFDKPEREVQWDIFFEPVVDENGCPISNSYVIVIYIASCPGGVFAKEPESYHIVEGDVKKMSFQIWLSKFISVFPLPPHVLKLTWSSEKNQQLFCMLSEKLVDHRDAGDMDAFNKLCKLAIEKFPDSNAELIVKAGEVTIAYKRYEASKAKALLGEFEELLSSSKDRSIFQVRMLLSQCLVERSTKNYEASYEIAKRGLQELQNIPVGLNALWLYLEAAMNATCIAFAKPHDAQSYRSLKMSALQDLEMAAGVASKLEELQIPFRMDDFQHKQRIYKAWILLNCSITGDEAQVKPSCEDITTAADELASVFQSVLKGKALTAFRKTEYHLAECDLFRRRAEVLEEDYILNMKQAFECGSKAQALATKHRFANMIDYASKRQTYISEKLNCHNDMPERTFLGLKY